MAPIESCSVRNAPERLVTIGRLDDCALRFGFDFAMTENKSAHHFKNGVKMQAKLHG